MNYEKVLLLLLLLFHSVCGWTQNSPINRAQVREDLNEILNDLTHSYIYLDEKEVDLECIRNYYEAQIDQLGSEEDVVLFFEYLLDEFYDSHLILNTNRKSSYRLYSPLHTITKERKTLITNVWQSQIQNLKVPVLGAEVVKINGVGFQKVIDDFPTHCCNKNSDKVRTWIANKVLAGRYNEPRILSLKMKDGSHMELDLDRVEIRKDDNLLSVKVEKGIGIVRINNSLGNSDLIETFDQALDRLNNTKGLILDLRNTVDGGNSYVARAIMGRFIETKKAYQMHWTLEKEGEHPAVERSWVEYVSPRGKQYEIPLVVLVGRWTGSMGEGLAIGLDGMQRAIIVGTEMERLAGAMYGFSFLNRKYSYRISTEKLFHVNGTPREKYVPAYYVPQTQLEVDEVLDKGLKLINQKLEE